MNTVKFTSKLIFLMLFVLFFGNFGKSVIGQNPVNFEYAEKENITTIDPLSYDLDNISKRLTTLLYNKLVGVDPSGRMVPELLERLEPISYEKLTYRFRLKQNIKWVGYNIQVGEVAIVKELTARDVVYTFNRIKNEKTRYKGITKYISEVKNVDSDKYTIEFVLINNNKINIMSENARQNMLLKYLNFPIIPEPFEPKVKLVEIKGRNIISTGPFVAAEETAQSIKLVRNQYYFKKPLEINDPDGKNIYQIFMEYHPDARPTIDLLSLPSAKNLKLNMIIDLPIEYFNELSKNDNISMDRHEINNFSFFAYNCKSTFSDVNVRRAFTYAIDRKKMLELVYGDIFSVEGKSIQDLVVINHCGLPPDESPPVDEMEIIDYDPVKARSLLKESGFTRRQLNLLRCKGTPNEDRVCRMFKDYIKANLDIDIDIDHPVTALEWKQKFFSGNFDIAYGTWIIPKDVNVIQSLFSKSSEYNFGSYFNSDIEEMLKKYDLSVSDNERLLIKHEMAKIICKEVPYTFLFQLPKYGAFRSDVLKGVIIHPYDFFSYIENWYIVKPK